MCTVFKPYITIIVATKNVNKTIINLLNSLKMQTSKDFELIIIDSMSTDGTLKTIKKNRDVISQLVVEKDKGISDAWNKGIMISKGEWILFLGGDDFLYSDKTIENSIEKLKVIDKKTLMAYGQIVLIDENNSHIGTEGNCWEVTKKRFNSIMNIPHQGVYHRRSLFKKVGLFNINYIYAADYDICIKAIKLSKPIFMPNIIISKMMYGGQSSKASHSWKVIEDFRKIRIDNNLSSVTVLWTWILVKSIFKLLISKLIGDNKTYWYIKLAKKFFQKK